MTEILLSPKDYGLKHDEWRPGQREAIEWAANLEQNGILQAATGTGKTAIPRALSQSNKVVSLVRTKVLQQANYADGYDFVALYGKGNYPCTHDEAQSWYTAEDCFFRGSNPKGCHSYHNCRYHQQRYKATQSDRAALNYPYWFNVAHLWPDISYLVCDEAHQLPEMILEHAGTTVSEKVADEYLLAPFPMIRGEGGIIHRTTSPALLAIDWLRDSIRILEKAYHEIVGEDETEVNNKAAKKIENLIKKFKTTFDLIHSCPDDWYIRSGPGAGENGQPAFVARPLTARHHFKRYFEREKMKTIVMSATIGDPEIFGKELGISNSVFHSIPGIYPKEARPVIALPVGRIGSKTSEAAYNLQAELIAQQILDCPKDWAGIIHTTSIAEAKRLAQRLSDRGLADRIWVTPEKTATEKMSWLWHERVKRVPGSICVSWALWEGYDPPQWANLRICVVAKVPYKPLATEYDIERRNYDPSFYNLEIAWKLEQGLGRSRRGRPGDYDTPEERRGLVMIADESYKWMRYYFSEELKEAIVTL